MAGRLQDKVVIITGAANGIGLAGAKLMAQEGAKVVATDNQDAALAKNIQPFIDAGSEITTAHLDVTVTSDWEQVVNETVQKYGHVDILVNNAGVQLAKGILETSESDWDTVMNVNAKGVWLGMRAVIPIMMKNRDGHGQGSIINTSSVAAMAGGAANANSISYSASKGAVDSMTRYAAQRYAQYHIRINNVNPGPIHTGMVKATDMSLPTENARDYQTTPPTGEPDDIAYAFIYLASDEARFVTGANLVIDGGWSTN